jgi:hypothetical protein
MNAARRGEDLAAQQLTVDTFPAFYTKLVSLQFPLAVSDVIEIRGVINQAADDFIEPVPTKGQLRFVQAIRSAIGELGIDTPHHAERLIHVLVMLRCLRYAHHAIARQARRRLSRCQQENLAAKRVSIKYGVGTLVATAASAMVWLGIDDVAWPVKVGTVLFGYLCFDYFYSLSSLTQDYRHLGQQLEALEQERVRVFDWKTLVKHVALVLGYMPHQAVEPFVISHEESTTGVETSGDHRAALVVPAALRIGKRLVPTPRLATYRSRHRP